MARKNNYARTILVTGGAGFIGSNYLNTCVPRYPEYHFINLDLLTYAGDLSNVEIHERPNYLFVNADIRDLEQLRKIFNELRPTDIIHFAAESHVDKSIESPSIFVETNVAGTHNLLILAREFDINRYYQISTDEVYGSLKKDDPAFTEENMIAPRSPYSASKAAADLLVLSYFETYGVPVVITRCSNNYGPRQDLSKLIPLFITRLLRHEKVPLYGTGENIRDWIYVDDHVEAIDLVFHKAKPGSIYNVGGECEKNNLEITHTLLEILGKDKSHIEWVTDRPGHDFRYAMNISKIRDELGWKPKVKFEDGIRRKINFYKKRHAHA